MEEGGWRGRPPPVVPSSILHLPSAPPDRFASRKPRPYHPPRDDGTRGGKGRAGHVEPARCVRRVLAVRRAGDGVARPRLPPLAEPPPGHAADVRDRLQER